MGRAFSFLSLIAIGTFGFVELLIRVL
jgi:hypothetical protein